MHSPYLGIGRSRGFSLVEIMVGMGIAMVATLVIMQTFSIFEGQKRTATTGSDAQTDAAVAVFTVERDARIAGYGLGMPAALGCKINASYDGDPLQHGGGSATSFSLTPVTITNGANGLPDSIEIMASSKTNWSIPSRIITDHPPEATNMFLNTTQGIAVNDLLIIFEPGKDCTLVQVTGIPNGNVQIHHQNTSPWNPPGGQNIFPPGGYGVGAMAFNLGALIDHTYSIDAGNNLVLTTYQSTTNSNTVQPLVANIVNLQAQYGFDTRPGEQVDTRVDTWSDVMVDADGSGITGDAGDLRRIFAIRMAVVARSAQKEKPGPDGTCTVTTADSGNSPSWANGSIDVSRNPDGSANADWQCYRYKVFETIVPMRNLLWRDE